MYDCASTAGLRGTQRKKRVSCVPQHPASSSNSIKLFKRSIARHICVDPLWNESTDPSADFASRRL
ncbi:MAG: hypothetical protein DWI02_02510 [Planctomycetota bacterium]|nr:MAG: hypothetical protein DWI02_02510 [Planctomycetota bacterium]